MVAIAWLMSLPEKKQFKAGCLIIIVVLGGVVVWQELRYEKKEEESKKALMDCKQQQIDFYKQSSETAGKMRDSLYILGMKTREIETQIINNKEKGK